jgi:hypothetical protein
LKTAATIGAPRFNDGRDWFMQKRFGLFTHWGIFSVAGWDSEEMYLLYSPRPGWRNRNRIAACD